jgi:hypothetical protein
MALDDRHIRQHLARRHRHHRSAGRNRPHHNRLAATALHTCHLRKLGVAPLKGVRVHHLDAFAFDRHRRLGQAVLPVARVLVQVADGGDAHRLKILRLPLARVQVLLRRLEDPLAGLSRLRVLNDRPR